MPARIVIQDQEYEGKVLNVANQPSSELDSREREGVRHRDLDRGRVNGLRPGMSAKVTILIEDVKDVLALPVSSVVEQKGVLMLGETPRGSGAPPAQARAYQRQADRARRWREGRRCRRTGIRGRWCEAAREEPPFEKQTEDAKFKDLGRGRVHSGAREGRSSDLRSARRPAGSRPRPSRPPPGPSAVRRRPPGPSRAGKGSRGDRPARGRSGSKAPDALISCRTTRTGTRS